MNSNRTKDSNSKNSADAPMGAPLSDWNGQNVLWVCMALLWWLGSLLAWLCFYTQSWIVVTSKTWSDPALNSGLLTGCGLFVLLVSATLRLPAITESTNSSRIQNLLVWFLCLGANVNWLGMLCLRAETLWPLIPLLGLAVAGEYWLVSYGDLTQLSNGAGSGQILNKFRLRAEHTIEPSGGARDQADSSPPNVEDIVDPAEGCVLRTMLDQVRKDGCRHVSGEIFVSWDQGQKSQVLVVGFVPALQRVPEVEFETDCSQTTTRCLNCTECGFRVEIKRQGSLIANEGMLAWSAIEIADDIDVPNSNLPNQPAANSVGLA